MGRIHFVGGVRRASEISSNFYLFEDNFDRILLELPLNVIYSCCAATNNVASKTPQELCKETMDTLGAIQKNNPKAKIAFSTVFRRKDSHERNSKVTQLNELLSEKLPLDGFDMIENDDILFSNLKSDGLHFNEGGVRKFAGSLNKFIKYC